MTFCAAMLCDKSKAIVLVADKMVGIGYIETEPDITKILPLHANWKVMFAGDDVTPISNIVDRARTSLTLSAASTSVPALLQKLNPSPLS